MPGFLFGRISAAVVLGIANHVYFNRSEPRRTLIFYTTFSLLLQPTLLNILFNHYDNAPATIPSLSITYLMFFTSLATSIILYRISPFHPLAQVPGSLLPKMTKFYAVFRCCKGDLHIRTKHMHDRYGPIIRIGPNEISVNDANLIPSILGTDGLPKGPAYLISKLAGQPRTLAGTKGQERIDRRRVWMRGFKTESLKEYQPLITEKVAQLRNALLVQSKSNRGEVNLMQWFNFFSFDFMAEMAFGGGSSMLKDGYDRTNALKIIEVGMQGQNILTQIPWLSYLANSIPSELGDLTRSWCTRRMEMGAEKKDLWYHLMDEAGNEKVKPTTALVASDSITAMVAGSDTTATALANLFWCLLAHPDVYKQLQGEVDREYPRGVDPLMDTSRHGTMKYLLACVNESLRLLPPVPTSGARVVPKGSGGRVIGGYFIPEGTQVYVPPYSAHLNPDNFSPAPDAFLPERWLRAQKACDTLPCGPEIFKQEAFIAFSYGPANCIGKNLAMNEIMAVAITLLQQFKFEFGDGFDWRGWREEKRDIFVSKNGPLLVTITPR